MDTQDIKLSTGLPGLDKVLKGLIPGDNVVWQVQCIEDYLAIVTPYAAAARQSGRKLIYFRFASHQRLLPPDFGAETYELKPEEGFENFIADIHRVIERSGRGAFYVFDCLSELAGDWYSDQMLGNFFMLTCPYLFDLETIAYFALSRNSHSAHATEPIAETTQLLLDVVHNNGRLFIRPIKVLHRHSPTMHMLHEWRGDNFLPVTSSSVIADILATSGWNGLGASQPLDFTARAVLEAREALAEMQTGRGQMERMVTIFSQLSRMVVSREPRISRLVAKYFSLDEVVDITKRMIGTGLIGGKTSGMLLARAMLRKTDKRFEKLLETHDSFYVGSDVFYTFLVRNGVWWARQKQRNPAAFLEDAELARRRILTGRFPDYILKQFEQMLDYFGQSPFIVRSSSLLEDNFGNSFAGKYESVFCANQGPRERRMEDFLAAVRSIYASTMSERALRYRASRGLLDQDEQMALLIMRVSGEMHGSSFFPAVAGVGFSFNPYVWSEDIDPKSGVVRLVFGLGTRAVNRSDDDYTRIVALNAPSRRPETNFDEVRQYSQRRVDYLDLQANQLVSGYFTDVLKDCGKLPMDLFTSTARSSAESPGGNAPVLTFNRLLSDTNFVQDFRDILQVLQSAYDHQVDIEFTANFESDSEYRINLVQCRPLQAKGIDVAQLSMADPAPEDRILVARCAVVGQSRVQQIDRFIYVVPARYGQLTLRDRHEVAQLLGEINRATDKRTSVMMLGPGRWGTSSPELGVPVAFSDINHVSVLCELVTMRDDFVPDVSLGTHFLNELVEMDMLYIAVFPKQENTFVDQSFFEKAPSRLLDVVPTADKWLEVVRIIETAEAVPVGKSVELAADALQQRVVCHIKQA